MSRVSIQDLSLRLGAFRLKDLSLALEAGEILVLLGPNGAGKSVSLEAIAGFHRLDAGRISIGGRDVTRLAPERRNVGLLFQDFSLFPHLTVAQNVVLASSARRPAPGRQAGPLAGRDPGALLDYFGIAHLARHWPRQLSPGEKQRAALARGFASAPDLFLFDEPFSALDMPTREHLRADLARFLRETRVPTIFVTHDQADAQAFADRIAIMRQGEVVQSGSAGAVLRAPADRFVAAFLGIENILAARPAGAAAGLGRVSIAGRTLHVAAANMPRGEPREVDICIRAEDVEMRAVAEAADRAVPEGRNRFTGRIVAMARLGAICKVTLDCGFPLQACALGREIREKSLAVGRLVEVEIAPESIYAIGGPAAALAA